MGHYGLLQVPDLLTGSFALRPDEVFIVANQFLVVANELLMTLEPFLRKALVLANTIIDALELSMHSCGSLLAASVSFPIRYMAVAARPMTAMINAARPAVAVIAAASISGVITLVA